MVQPQSADEYTAAVPTAAFTPVRAERAHEVVARQIREAILSGVYAPGDRLPFERELVESFGVSRSGVRQAILLLQQQGLVEVRAGSGGGAFVRDTGIQPLLNAIENVLAVRGVTPGQFLEAKQVVEPVLSAAAAEHVTDEIIGRLRDNIAAGRTLEGDAGGRLANATQFHEILAAATGNPVLELVLVALSRIAESMPEFRHADGQDWDRVLDEHDVLTDALERRSKDEVHELMVRHLRSIDEIFVSAPLPGRRRSTRKAAKAS